MTFRRVGIAAFATTAMLATLVPSAQAVHWPFLGGDNGRSGNQPVDAGGLPVPFVYKEDAASEQFIKTSIVTTTGPPTTAADGARFAFGTRDGVVQIRRLADGAPIGSAAGVDIGDDDAFGTRSAVPGANGSSVSFADTSDANGLGQLYVAHNDDSEIGDSSSADIEIAQFDEATGDLVKQVDVAGTDGFTIRSSLLETGPGVDDPTTNSFNEDGTRVLFFVASNAGGTQALFRVAITGGAASRAAVINGAAATTTGDIGATELASPTMVYLSNAQNVPIAHVAVGTATGLRTFSAATLLSGPALSLAGETQTPAVPVQPSGVAPSPTAGSAVTSAPVIYVASSSSSSETTVYKITGTTAGLSVNRTSPALSGSPAPGLATSQQSEGGLAEGKVIVTTGANLYLLTTYDLDRVGQLVSGDSLLAGTTGFKQTVAALSGDFIYAANDQAEQFVLRLSDGKPVSSGAFSAGAGALANSGVGQPTISRGFIQYGGGRGAFVYRNGDLTNPAVSPMQSPAPDTTVEGIVTLAVTASDGRGVASVTFRLNGGDVGTDTTDDSGSPFSSPGAVFSTTLDTTHIAQGLYLVDAVAIDSYGRRTTSEQRRMTIRGATDDRPPTVSFSSLKEEARVKGPTLISISASDDRSVRSVEIFNGLERICIDATVPFACTFAPRGSDVGRTTLVAVATDTAGQTASATRNLLVSRLTPKSLSSQVSPSRVRRSPYLFTITGRLALPAGVRSSDGCGEGIVSVQVKVGSRTVSSRRVGLRNDCSYRSTVSFTSRQRLGRSGRLKFTSRFLGNKVLTLLSASWKYAKAG